MLDIGKGKKGFFHMRTGQFVEKDAEMFGGVEPDIMWPTGTNRVRERYDERKVGKLFSW